MVLWLPTYPSYDLPNHFGSAEASPSLLLFVPLRKKEG
ncbi:MAG: hypothetical protein SLRJCFUN_002557 [Candidatus Fervidibacter sp.]